MSESDGLNTSQNSKPERPLTVLVSTASGRKLLLSYPTAVARMRQSLAGQTAQAKGLGYQWTSDTARAAARKRWKRHPMTARGYRKGQRFTRRPNVKRAPLREKYAVAPSSGIQYHPSKQQWSLSDALGTRVITERTALRRLGYLPGPTDRVLPVKIERVVRTTKG